MRKQMIGRHTHGQAIVLVALVLVILVAAAGLGIDGANAFNQRRNTNNGADAASMAATRALITQRKNHGTGDNINLAVQEYLDEHLADVGGSFAWQAYYVNRQGQRLPVGSPQLIKDGEDVLEDAQGVQVDVQYTFDTYFMSVLARNDLTVTGSGMALYGPIGSTIGPDLIPIAIDQTATQNVMNSGNSSFEMNLFGATAGTYLVEPGNFGAVSFDPDGSNRTGTHADCTGSTPKDSASYWWCHGSQYMINIGMDLDGNPGTLSSSLKDEIEWRIDHRPIALLPVFAYTDGNGNNTTYHVVGFLAVKLIDIHTVGANSERSVKAKYINYYTAPGALVGDGNGVDTGTYAINLVR